MKPKRMKLLESVEKMKQKNCSSLSPHKHIRLNDTVFSNSFIRCKSSVICKLFPKSPTKYVSVLCHIWQQSYKSPRKCKLMNSIWSKDKEMSSMMLELFKQKACKNAKKLAKCVEEIKKKYSSLRKASSLTTKSWTQFCRYCSLEKNRNCRSSSKYVHKLNLQNISNIKNHMMSEEFLIQMPDRKYAGKRFMRCIMEHSLKMYNLSESTKRKVSLSTFFQYRPKFVKLQGRIPLRQSCCECCLNFENVLQQASKYLKAIPQELNKAIDASMCSYDSYFPNIDCIL